MRGTKVYIYGLLNDDNEITYIGKASEPRTRLYQHKVYTGNTKLEILDFFYDKEMYWIEKMKGVCKLTNKIDKPFVEEWEVGDIVEIGERKTISFIDKMTNKKYNTIAEASNEFGISRDRIRNLIFNDNVKEKYKDEYRFELL